MTRAANRRIPISRVVIGDEEIAAVVNVLRSGNLREGEQVHAFEQEFAQAVGAKHALAVNSGTAALHLAYAALVKPGDEVLVPSFTFFATASMMLAVGATPVFCDIDPETLNLDVEDAASRIGPRTAAIAPVHLFGNPADVDAVKDLARAHGLSVIWDAAQAHGATWHRQDVGSLGDAVCYSFYPTKNMTTGEGGMICTNRADVAEKVALLRNQGQADKYVHTVLGFNFRMTEMQAAIGRVQLRRLPGWIGQRRANAEFLRERLSDSDCVRVQREQTGGTHAYHQFSIILDRRIDRDGFAADLDRVGIGCAVHYPVPLHRQPIFTFLDHDLQLHVSEEISRRVLSLPVQPILGKEELKFVANGVLAGLSRLDC